MGKVMACKESDLPKGSLLKVVIDGKDIIVGNADDTLFALDDTCTHAGTSLAEGKLAGTNLVCGWHGAEFDCRTGKLAKFPAKIRDLGRYDVTIESGQVFIEV